MKEHDQLALARTLMERKLDGRRTSSKLPELVELVMAKPLVSTGMVAKTLEVTPQAAWRIALELGLRERRGGGGFGRGGLSSRETIGALRSFSGYQPTPEVSSTYFTTRDFLSHAGFATLCDLPHAKKELGSTVRSASSGRRFRSLATKRVGEDVKGMRLGPEATERSPAL